MTRRARLPLVLTALLAALAGCPPLPDFATCEEADACSSTSSASTSGDDENPTTSDGVQTVTSADPDASTGSTTPDAETGAETVGTTDQPDEPPAIVVGVVMPDYIDDNGVLAVEASTVHADGVRMLLDNGEQIELTMVRPGEFVGRLKS